MEFSDKLTFSIKLTKSLIINLIEKCLYTDVFNNATINPCIDCSLKNERFELKCLRLDDFKNEIMNSTEFTTFSMVVLYNTEEISYSLVLLKVKSYEDEFEISLTSNKKSWIDDSIIIIKNFFDNYTDTKYVSTTITDTYIAPNSKVENKENVNIIVEHNIKNKNINWTRDQKLGALTLIATVISIIVTVIISVF
ncbi:hypothetical protein DVV91_10505 [Clostridium botulinum]|uniref:hypothetical protein n=1 Tax=Clostridium botulinum TaxID=1491 RepID=UPI0019670021|nr:hypothetical protein [Clostridium botulinum]MBN1074774.1 hypothetical protein [Clostridium botulinum]